jgi:signal peptidase I
VVSLVRKIFKVVYEMIEAFVVSASIFVVIYLFLMQPHQVKGSSMFPTFETGQYLLTDKITLKRREPARGDVIVFKSPLDENFDFIKRVLAIPGDTIMIEGGELYLNNRALSEDYLPSDYTTSAGRFLREGAEFVVPESMVMAIGDNRDHSSDSREWGPVPYENIVGRAFFRYWPTDTAGTIRNPVIE